MKPKIIFAPLMIIAIGIVYSGILYSMKCYTERAVDKHPKIW